MTRELTVKTSSQNAVTRKIVASYVKSAVSENSRRAFKADLNHFITWGGSIPASPEMVAAYVSSFAGTLSTATLQRRLATISKAHRLKDYTSPIQAELVRMTMKGICRVHGKPQKRATPLLKEDLLTLLSCIPQNLRGARDRALLLIGFAGAFRRSELVAINCGDLEFTDQGLIITLLRSKTDQAGQGRQVAIPHARGMTCPVKALKDWLDEAGIIEGAVFRSISKNGVLRERGLSAGAIPYILTHYTASSGHLKASKRHYSGHSLRSGFVTSAATQGAATWKIRAQTGHKSDSMLERYIRDADIFNNNAAGSLF